MKKILTILVLLISGAIHAQEFNFSCEPDCNRQVSVQSRLMVDRPDSEHTHGLSIVGFYSLDPLVVYRDADFVPEEIELSGVYYSTGLGTSFGGLDITSNDVFSCEDGFVLNDDFDFAVVPQEDVIDLTPILPELRAAGLDDSITELVLPLNLNGGAVYLNEDNIGPFDNGDRASLIEISRGENEAINEIRITAQQTQGPLIDIVLNRGSQYEILRQAIMFMRIANGQRNNIIFDFNVLYGTDDGTFITSNNGTELRRVGDDTGFYFGSNSSPFIYSSNQFYYRADVIRLPYTVGSTSGIAIVNSYNSEKHGSRNNFISQMNKIVDAGTNVFRVAGGTAIFATETGAFTKDNNSRNKSVIDLTPLSRIYSTTRINVGLGSTDFSFHIGANSLSTGDHVYMTNGSSRYVTTVTMENKSGTGAPTFEAIGSNSVSGLGWRVWRIPANEFGIIEIDRIAGNFANDLDGFYDLRNFNWTDATHFDMVNNFDRRGFSNSLAVNSNAGILGISFVHAATEGGGLDQSFARRIFGEDGGQNGDLAIISDSDNPIGFGVYRRTSNVSFDGAWYSHDLYMTPNHSSLIAWNDDFRGKKLENSKLSGAAFIR